MSVRSYVYSLVAAAVICSLLTALVGEGTAGRILKTLCGVVLALQVISPLARKELILPELPELSLFDSADVLTEEGESRSRDALAAVIQQELEAYIQDKAAELKAEVTVEVTLNRGDPPLPESVTIRGSISPYARQQLQKILLEQLGIPKEHLEWTG